MARRRAASRPSTFSEQLERAALEYFFTEKKRDFSLAALEALAARKRIAIPAGALRSARTVALKRVQAGARLAGVRTDGIKLDDGKALPKPTSKNAKRLSALRRKMRWTEAAAAKKFGVELKDFKRWERGDRLWDTEARLLAILEAPQQAQIKGARSLPTTRAWKLKRQDSRRLFALMSIRGWSVASACTAFGVGPRTIALWLDGSMVIKGSARKVLEFYEKDPG